MNAEALPLTITEVSRSDPAPLPFLPGTTIQYAWDSTSLSMLKTCPRLYAWTMIEGWGSREESIHLTFGRIYHSALERYDWARFAGFDRPDAIREAVGLVVEQTAGWKVDLESKAGRYKNRDTLIALVVDYLDKFKDDVAETVVIEENRPAVELSFRFELDWGPGISGGGKQYIKAPDNPQGIREFEQPYLLCGHLDRVVSYSGGLFVMDRKTTTMALGSYYFDRYEPDNQMTLYSLAAQVILGSPIRGVIIDAAQILLEKPNHFERGFTYRTPDQLEEWLVDLRYWLAQAESYATAGYWPANDTACDKYGGCRFREVCAKSPGVRERFLKGKFDRLTEEERWNPLKPR